ncbi:MAG: 5-(carboxyamino)imidazole ribonucleotide mutase [Alistipes sp.]|nr:5-(carboxyamino)imidazole ribonucleotide mutase [Rikenellaceae bacterium]MBQ6881611.1 5-(carboxyamino)imidazole ribonucleotide mutase [Alistipes sp.]MBR1994142.1 5-(carboxyamino)imidazole ribonucleotide mutase [Alistipes sp.]MBR3846049.1 5-(carboxyamino)imidazole ribonucleotide mutase [Alistipes sp.]MBR7170553.1 5-(carboxyamino)imidazole ribonucleotide mutase [Alistipes sp.]
MDFKIGIIMGSASDLEVMSGAMKTLEQFGIAYEKRVISAHRAPEALAEWTKTARERGLSVIIAGAGGAAHLPGVIAAMTTLPVIGVPVRSKALGGLDSLLSIVQMPSGIPVATMAIDGSKNAALYAIQMLALHDEALAAKLEAFRAEQTAAVLSVEI